MNLTRVGKTGEIDDSDSDDSDSDDSDDDDSGCLNPMTFSKRVGILRRYLLAASTVRGN